MPKRQRLTHKDCLEQTAWLGHFSATFDAFCTPFVTLQIKAGMLGALRMAGSIGLVGDDASLQLGIGFIAKKILEGLLN